VALKAAGKDLLGRCPFHEDREASLVVTPAKNLWHCFSCQIGGGPIDWMMKAKGVSFRHAVELLREGSDPFAAAPQPRHPRAAGADPLRCRRSGAAGPGDRLLPGALKQSPEALAYLARGGSTMRS
jgi:DNA primase